MNTNQEVVILISADAEWRVIKSHFPGCKFEPSPYGEWFLYSYKGFAAIEKPVVFMHGGWAKVAAAGSTQYAIDRWHPRLVINIGTCGGFEGAVQRGEIILAEKTIIYDIYEQMGDPEEHIRHFMADLDTSWLDDPLPIQVNRTILVSGDRDLFWKDVPGLIEKYGAVAGDWESGAIAWVACKNFTQCMILRGVTDLVGENGGEAYDGKVNYYYENTALIMEKLIESLPDWIMKYYNHSVG